MPEIAPYLIEKFLQNKCTPDEAAQVSDYLNDNPAVLEQYLGEKEWTDLEITQKLSKKEITNIKIAIDEHIGQKAKVISFAGVKKYLVAASILAIVALTTFWFFYNKNDDTQIAIRQFSIIQNAKSTNLDTVLPDGSVISLLPGASVKYYDDYMKNREVAVKGKVVFEEKKIAGHPFKVMAQDIITIPIGTKFSVNSIENVKQVIIHLLEGKVVVNAEDNSLKSEKIYLKPGEILTIDKINHTAIIKNINQHFLPKLPVKNALNENAKKKNVADALWTNKAIKFNKVKLINVFDKIAAQYNVTIKYNKEDFDSYYFTGDLYYNDSIDVLLKNICDVNKLTFTRNGTEIIINKSQP